MLTPAPADPDWFLVDGDETSEIVKALAIVPSLRLRRGRWQCHRSHLPVLTNVIEAQRLRSPIATSMIERAALDKRAAALGIKLRAAQYDAVTFASRRRGTLLGDEPRIGKTLSALLSHDPSRGPLLVVCPLIARDVWLSWIARVFPGEDVGVFTSKKFDLTVAAKPIVVCHYDILPYWQVVRRFGTIIFDEAHYLSKGATKRTRAAALLAGYSEKVIAATGTPVWNRPINLYSILGLIAPGAFGSKYLFGDRYCDPEPTAYGTRYEGISNEDELQARLSEVMIRRRWADVQRDLPPITRDLAIAEVSDKQAREIDFAVAEVRGGTAASLARFRRALGVVKVRATVEVARSILDKGEPTVIWTWHRDLAKQLAERLDGLLITGDTPQTKRSRIFDEWRSSPTRALVLTLAVAQVGIDLSHARIAVFAEVDYVPAMVAQAEMRTFSPDRAMHATYVIADHLIERKLVDALHDKLRSSKPIDVDTGGDAVDILRTAFNTGSQEVDLEQFVADLLSSGYEIGSAANE